MSCCLFALLTFSPFCLNLKIFRVFASYVAWASADRLIRLAVRRCVSKDPDGASVHAKYTAGDIVTVTEQQMLQQCTWQKVTQISSETHYGLPWSVSAALFDIGAPEEQLSLYFRDIVTPLRVEAACEHLQVAAFCTILLLCLLLDSLRLGSSISVFVIFVLQ